MGFVKLHTGGFAGVGGYGHNSSPGGTISDSDYIVGHSCEVIYPILCGSAGKVVHIAGAMRTLNDGAFKHEDIETYLLFQSIHQYLFDLFADFKADGGMVKDVDAKIGYQFNYRGLFCIEKRHGIAAAGTAFEPNQICHNPSSVEQQAGQQKEYSQVLRIVF